MLTAGLTTYQDTGLLVSLPAAGTYLLECDVAAQISIGVVLAQINAKLRDVTAGADVPNSYRQVVKPDVGSTTLDDSATISIIYVAPAGPSVVHLYAQVTQTTGVTTAGLYGQAGAAPQTVLNYVRLA